MTLKKLEQKNVKSIEEVISCAGTVIADETEKKKKWINHTLRIRKDLLLQIDIALEHRIGLTKSAWILEAIQEKLKRDSE